MGANKEGKAVRKGIILEAKLEGDTCEQAGKKAGVSEATAWRDWKEIKELLKEDEGSSDLLDEVIAKSLNNTLDGMSVEQRFILQERLKEELDGKDAQVVSMMTEKNQKRYSMLAGSRTDKKGGENIAVNNITFADGKNIIQ